MIQSIFYKLKSSVAVEMAPQGTLATESLWFTLFGGTITLTLLSALILSNINSVSTKAHAANAAANLAITVDPSCTITSSGNNSHTATMSNGAYNTTGIGTTTASVICDDYEGYSIYAVGYSNNTADFSPVIGGRYIRCVRTS